MATTTPNFGWPVPTSTDLVKDGATAMEALGDAIDTSMVDLKGGTTGQILSKASSADMDFSWTTPNPGDITGVTAGTGISGGGTSGDVTITNSMATAIDAKGDLVAGTADNTFSRLAVGNNGETLVADSTTSTGLRYTAGNVQANPVLNSAFQVAQRGTSIAVAAGVNAYTLDRWMYGAGGVGSASTISQQSTNDTTNLPNIQYCARLQRNAGQTGTTGNSFSQTLENINSTPFIGKTVTLSYYARAGANYSPTGGNFIFRIYSGTSTNGNVQTGPWTNIAIPVESNVSLTTTWQRFTATGTISSTATQIALYCLSNPTGTAGANDYADITGIQIDIGSVALPFRTYAGTIQGELAACQRYYWRAGGDQTTQALGLGYGTSTTNVLTTLINPVPMRTAPASVDFSLLWVVDYVGTTSVTNVVIPSGWAGKTAVAVNASVASGITSGRPYNLITQGTLSGYIGFSAEL